MSRWIWVILSVAISTLVYFTIRYGLNPKPIPLMNLTQFEDLEQMGAVVYKRLRQNMRQERVIIIGSSPEVISEMSVWSGFFKTALADRFKIDVVFQRRGQKEIPKLGDWETVEFDQTEIASGELFGKIKSRLQRGHLVVVHTSTVEGTHLVKSSLSKELDRSLRQPVISISTLPLALDSQAEDDLQALCLNDRDEEGVFRLNCAANRAAKKALKKKPDPTKSWAVLERHGLKEFLLFVYHNPSVHARSHWEESRLRGAFGIYDPHVGLISRDLAQEEKAFPSRPGYRVLLVGDSVTADQPFSGQLKAGLVRLNPKVKFNFLTAAVPGWDTWQKSEYLRTRAEGLKPDLVILQFCIDDFDKGLDRVTNGFKASAKLSRKLGFGLKIVLLPAIGETREFDRVPRETVRRIVAELNLQEVAVDLMDLTTQYASDLWQKSPGDPIHPNDEGASIIAEKIIDQLPKPDEQKYFL